MERKSSNDFHEAKFSNQIYIGLHTLKVLTRASWACLRLKWLPQEVVTLIRIGITQFGPV